MNRVIAKRPSKAKVDEDAAYQPVWGAGGEPGGTLLPSSKMTMTRSMRNSTSECSLPVCNVCAMPFPFLALRLGDLARAAGLRAGDLALAAGFRAGDWARLRGLGAGEAALALRVATMAVKCTRSLEPDICCVTEGAFTFARDGVWRQLNLLQSAAELCCVRRRAALLHVRI